MPKPTKVFVSYSHKDEALWNELFKHLALLRQDNLVTEWHDRRIAPGEVWNERIDENLRTADLVLLLLSPDFMASEYIQGVEVKLALRQHEQGRARVIPVVLRPVEWGASAFAKLQALPKDAKPVTKWDDPDDAFLDVVKGIRRALAYDEDASTQQTKTGAASISIPRQPTATISTAPLPHGGLFEDRFVQIYTDILDDPRSQRTEFDECIRRRDVAEKFTYIGLHEALSWRRLCEHEKYQPYNESVNYLQDSIHEIFDTVRKEYRGDLDFVCLGIGDGTKEGLFLKYLLGEQRFVNFFPVDASIDMLILTLGDFLKAFSDSIGRIRFGGILGDFKNLPNVKHIYGIESQPRNLFALLGNMIGNFDENDLLRHLYQAMDHNDFLVVDCQLSPPVLSKTVRKRLMSSYTFPVYKDHAFACLAKLGLQRERDGDIVVEFQEGHPSGPGAYEACTINVAFELWKDLNVHLYGGSHLLKKGERIRLGYSVKYTRFGLLSLLEDHGFEVLGAFGSGENYYGIAVARRKPN